MLFAHIPESAKTFAGREACTGAEVAGKGARGRECLLRASAGEHLGRGQDGDGSVVVKRLLEEVALQASSSICHDVWR